MTKLSNHTYSVSTPQPHHDFSVTDTTALLSPLRYLAGYAMYLIWWKNNLTIPTAYPTLDNMEPTIIFVSSAFKHGATEADIRHAYETKIYSGPLEGYENKYAFIGFNRAGNPIEVFFNPIDDDTMKVFHAMICRNSIIEQFQ